MLFVNEQPAQKSVSWFEFPKIGGGITHRQTNTKEGKMQQLLLICSNLLVLALHLLHVCHAEEIVKEEDHRGHPLDGKLGKWDCETSDFETRKGEN